MMVIPMFDKDDEIIGAFQVINHKGQKETFDQEDMERLMLASTYAAETLISAGLTKEIEETQREVVFTMGAIGESRSKETGNHVIRVAEYSKVLALAYGLSQEEAELLKQASPMHDIGKIAIPDMILNKPGRFNDQERKVMETHAQKGFSMIKNSQRPLLKTAAIVAYEHHEKWNGKGYPQGISAENIHIYGRITAIADVFDALGSDRVYKKAWSDEKILKLFQDEKGEHFDPCLVDLFFENLETFFKIRDEFKDTYSEVKEIQNNDFNHIKVLGAFGNKARGYGTSSFYINEKNVIDAGNLLKGLEEKSIDLDNIWITHSHLDHIYDIANIIDNYYASIKKTINICALPQTIKAIKEHFLNDVIWPDFSKIKLIDNSSMCIKYIEVKFDKNYQLSDNEIIKAFKTDHTVPSCGYIYKKNDNAILITADTYALDNVIEIVNTDLSIKSIVLECSFPSYMLKLAKESKHLTPELLFENIKKIKRDDIQIYINHIKPIFLDEITAEIQKYSGKWELKILKDGDIINF